MKRRAFYLLGFVLVFVLPAPVLAELDSATGDAAHPAFEDRLLPMLQGEFAL